MKYITKAVQIDSKIEEKMRKVLEGDQEMNYQNEGQSSGPSNNKDEFITTNGLKMV